jgi:hypothetical protein
VPRRACGMVDARFSSRRAGTAVLAGWPCCCSGRSGSCVVSDKERYVALLVDLYLSQGICSRSAVDFRVGHLGICLIRVAIGLSCSSGWSLRFLEILTVIPELSAPERGSGVVNLLSQVLEFFFTQRVLESLARLVDAMVFLRHVSRKISC